MPEITDPKHPKHPRNWQIAPLTEGPSTSTLRIVDIARQHSFCMEHAGIGGYEGQRRSGG